MANRKKNVLWMTATLMAGITLGVAFLASRRNGDTPDPARIVSRPVSELALFAAEQRAGNVQRPVSEFRSDILNLPKTPVDQPFEFVRMLARTAYEGNGEAQYRIAREIDRCDAALTLVRKSSDPEADIWNLPAGWTQNMKERAFAEYQRCSRLLRDDPFAELPARAGGYTADYWWSRAFEAGHPVVVVEKTIRLLPAVTDRSAEAEELRAMARKTLATAVLSGNPDALLEMGYMMSNSPDAELQKQGAAWMLAGCRVGADCGFDSAIVPLWMCYDDIDAQCHLRRDVESMLVAASSVELHARYEQISAALRARDVEALEAQLGF